MTPASVTLVTAVLADGRENENAKVYLSHCKHRLMSRPRPCLSRQTAEGRSFNAIFEGGCYEVSQGGETQV
jgi:hypothetical protein